MSCGAVILRDTPDGLRVLMLRVFRHWDFPKGLMEAGEKPKQTAEQISRYMLEMEVAA